MSTQLLEVFNDEHAAGVAYKNKSHKRSIINHLDAVGHSTVADLALAMNVSAPKVITLINELINDGLIADYGKVESTGGRRAAMYGLVSEAAFFVGVDVKKYGVNLGLLDFKKNLVTLKEEVPFLLENSAASFEQLLAVINAFLDELPVDRNKILSMGVNLSGRINHTSGYSYSFYHFHEEPLATLMEQKLGMKVYLDNDSRAMAYGEFLQGVVKNERNVLFVNLDYGIGLGILVDGRVYYGKSGFSGEFGHIPFFPNELICHCGKKGCLETEASGNALVRMFMERTAAGASSQLLKKLKKGDPPRLQQIVEAANGDDVLCIELIAEVGEKLGKGLAVLINIFNPDLVILGGLMAQTGDYLRLPLRSALNKFSLSLVNNDSQLKMSKLGDKAGVIGGCLMARNKVFERVGE